MISFEKKLLLSGLKYIAGVDEVGRGCLAGPMVVAAVILKPRHLSYVINNDVSSGKLLEAYKSINDSKLLTYKKRAELAEFIKNHALSFSIYEIDNKTIDNLGISECTQVGFNASLAGLSKKPHHILTDAFKIKQLPTELQTNIIKGDRQSITIAAASIIAKVYRDTLMENFHEKVHKYKVYGFDKHKGYGTKLHLEAIRKHGPSSLHRLTFKLRIDPENHML